MYVAQIAKWLAVHSPEERSFALQVLLAVVNADPAVIDRLVSSSGAVRSVLGALRRSIAGALLLQSTLLLPMLRAFLLPLFPFPCPTPISRRRRMRILLVCVLM